MVKLLSSAVMPSPEFAYRPCRIGRQLFIRILRESQEKGILESYIGYPNIANHIARISGIDIHVNRTEATVQEGDIILVCKLKHRITEPMLKNNPEYLEALEDYDYWLIEVVNREAFVLPQESHKLGMTL